MANTLVCLPCALTGHESKQYLSETEIVSVGVSAWLRVSWPVNKSNTFKVTKYFGRLRIKQWSLSYPGRL